MGGTYQQLSLDLFPSEAQQISHIEEAERAKPAPSALSFSQADIDAELCRGSGYSGGQMRIYALYQHQPDAKTAVAFLKDEYNWFGHSHTFMDGSSGYINYSPKGMKLDHYKPAYEKTLKWNAVEKRIRTLIAEDRYLTENEKAQYAALEQEYAGLGGVPMPVARMGFQKPEEVSAEKSETIWNYNTIKQGHPNDLVLYQVGDFFEM